jgi:hypothetical protein
LSDFLNGEAESASGLGGPGTEPPELSDVLRTGNESMSLARQFSKSVPDHAVLGIRAVRQSGEDTGVEQVPHQS